MPYVVVEAVDDGIHRVTGPFPSKQDAEQYRDSLPAPDYDMGEYNEVVLLTAVP